MRGRLVGAAMMMALPAYAAPPEDHSFSLINASTVRVDFADQHAQLAKNGFVNFSILTVLAGSEVAYSMSQVSLNCSSKQIATLSNMNYSAKGAALPTPVVDSAPQAIATGTLGQSLQAVVCSGADPYPRSKPLTSIAAAVARAHELVAALTAPPAK